MATVATAFGQPNGLARGPSDLAEYQKILKLRDEIFAGVHPRLKVPEHAVRKVPQTSQPSHLVQSSIPAATTTSIPEPKVPGLNLSKPSGDVSLPQPALNGSSTIGPSPASKSTASALNPIFLTKSDELIKAEIQLQRQRLEKQLREQAENKRNEARAKAAVEEAKPDFDVTEVFERALELVKPISLSELQEAAASASDSFDEHSFYSSRAPDSTPEHGEDRSARSRYRKARAQAAAVDLDEDEGELPDDVGQPGHTGPKPAGLGRRSSRVFSSNLYQQPQDPTDRYSPPDAHITVLDDDDEPEYSPPEAEEPPLAYSALSSQKQRRRSNGRPNGPNPRRESPAAEVRIVRNTITSPLAPQPARVSLLARTKGSPILQNRRSGQDANRRQLGGMESERTSPEMQTVSRKRRKVQDGKKGRHPRRGQSPGHPIKDEPVSPPPFHDVPPLGGASGQRSERPIYVDIDIPGETRYVPVDRPIEYQPRPATYAIDGASAQPAPIRSVSRPIYREPVRDTQDLRRVASLHNMAGGSQGEYLQPAGYRDQPVARTPSYTVLDHPQTRAESVVYEAAPRTHTRQYVQEQPQPTSPVYRDEYTIERPISRAAVMAAPQALPQRRIVVDEAGNRYYETIAPPREAPIREVSMAPPARQVFRDPYGAPSTQYIRATSVFDGPPQPEVRYKDSMPPPPPLPTRYSVAPRPEVYERPTYAHESPYQSGGNVQIIDYQPRHQSGYLEDRQPQPREEYVRMGSVRPNDPYGAQPDRIIQRVASVRPIERAVSVFQERPREYVQAQPQPQLQYTSLGADSNGDIYYRRPPIEANPMHLDGAREVRYSVAPQPRYQM